VADNRTGAPGHPGPNGRPEWADLLVAARRGLRTDLPPPFGLLPAILSALGVAALILVWRLVRHEFHPNPPSSGFHRSRLSARLIAYLLGEAKGYFSCSASWMSLIWAAVFALSVPDPPAPPLATSGSWVNGHGQRLAVGASGRARLRYRDADLGVGVRGPGSSSQHHLYDADQTGWLGVARIAMGWPLTASAALGPPYLAIKFSPSAPSTPPEAETRTRRRPPGDAGTPAVGELETDTAHHTD